MVILHICTTKSDFRTTHSYAHEMTVAAVAGGLSKYEKIKNMNDRRAQVYKRLFTHLTGHDSYEDACSDTRMLGNEGIVSVSDDEESEESGKENHDNDE
jgi:hypothetical protein